MKFLFACIFVLCAVYAQRQRPGQRPAQPPEIDLDKLPTPGTGARFERTLPADQLRDYPGGCFASTECKVYQPGAQWSLGKICGFSECVLIEEGERKFLVEKVHDCGPRPAQNFTRCTYTNENPSGEYPACCPIFTCDEDFDPKLLLLPPDAPEILALADKA